jgi:phenylacetate-CoA ligase
MSAAAQAGARPAWDWPNSIAADVMQRLIDIHATLLLERSPPEFWQGFQIRALRALVAHAQHVSPWWRQWLQVPAHDVSLETLARLPVLRRENFRAAVESAGALPLPPAHGSTRLDVTSGSSGVPSSFHVSKLADRLMLSAYHADHERHGRDLSQPMAALLARLQPHPGREHVYEPPNPARGFGPIFMRYSRNTPMREHARWLTRIDPVYLNTSPTVLCGMLDAYDDGLPPPRNVRQVLPIGETVSSALRAQALRVLGASIRDRYSCEEIGPIALQCPQDDQRFHVCVSNAIVEVVDDDGRPCAYGLAGSVLVTGLFQWASPAVRYDLGDIATLHASCICGEQVPTLSNLLGRKRFLLRLPSGDRVYMNIMAKHLTDVAPVREHRLTQYTEQDIRIEVVMDRPLTDAEREGLLNMLRNTVHAALTYHVEQVDAIAWAPTFKRQDLVCLV